MKLRFKRINLKSAITNKADDPLKYFFVFQFSEKIRLNMCIHIKCKVLYSLKNNKINLRFLSATSLLSALRLNGI